MSSSWRSVRVAFLLQVAIVCLVVVLGMLALGAINGEALQPVTLIAIVVALVAIGSVTWLTYRTARRMLASGMDPGVAKLSADQIDALPRELAHAHPTTQAA